MEAKIIVIGNSKGVRLPKAALRQCQLAEGQSVQIDVRNRKLVITAKRSPREGWDRAFQRTRSRRARENLWGDVPVAEAWDR